MNFILPPVRDLLLCIVAREAQLGYGSLTLGASILNLVHPLLDAGLAVFVLTAVQSCLIACSDGFKADSAGDLLFSLSKLFHKLSVEMNRSA